MRNKTENERIMDARLAQMEARMCEEARLQAHKVMRRRIIAGLCSAGAIWALFQLYNAFMIIAPVINGVVTITPGTEIYHVMTTVMGGTLILVIIGGAFYFVLGDGGED